MMSGLRDSNRRLPAALGLALILTVFTVRAESETISFPDSELASESVLPVVDNPVSVKNKNVVNSHRFELGVLGGLSLLEPFYSPWSFGLDLGYHITDEQAINLTGLFFMQGLSNNGNSLNPIPGSLSPVTNQPISANLQYAPAPKYLIMADYQYTGFYGKISLSKDFVMNLSVYGLVGLGAFGIGDGVYPTLDLGIGQKLYITPNFGIRADFRFVLYQGPDVLSRDLESATTTQPSSSFSNTTLYVSLLSLGVVYLFPGM